MGAKEIIISSEKIYWILFSNQFEARNTVSFELRLQKRRKSDEIFNYENE